MANPVALSTLLARVARELRKVEARLANLERTIGEIACEARRPQSRPFVELQEIDGARQETAGIAEFLDELALAVPAEWQADAQGPSRALGLETLAAALGRGEVVRSDAGECEVFD